MQSIYLRLSLTDRCNFNCIYCKSNEGGVEEPSGLALRDDEILALLDHINSVMPLRKVRLTGGEPLLRPKLPLLVSAIKSTFAHTELCLTTNGMRLEGLAEDLKAAGLDRINLSLDATDQETFFRITGGDLTRVLAGIHAARRAGFTDLRQNSVMLRKANGGRLDELVRLAKSHGAEQRFIELMPFGPARPFYDEEYYSTEEAIAELSASLDYLGPLELEGTARRHRFQVDGELVTVGFITPISHPFCSTCDRLRLDSRGHLYSCLRKLDGADLAEALRDGDETEVKRRISTLLYHKNPPKPVWPLRRMHSIGG